MADEQPKGRPMKFPYTTAAQIAQFPYRHYYKHNWLLKYWLIAVVVSAPLFLKFQRLSHAEGNVKIWEEKTRKTFSGHDH